MVGRWWWCCSWLAGGGVVGFEGWLCWILGLFPMVRLRLRGRETKRERQTKIRERRQMILGYIFYWIDILF